MTGNPIRHAESYGYSFDTQALGIGPGAEIHLTVENLTTPSISDHCHLFTVEEARHLAEHLLQSIQDTEETAATVTRTQHYPTPPADLALHLYGMPYGEEDT